MDNDRRLDDLEAVIRGLAANSVSLKEYFEARLSAEERALGEATRTMERRLAGMNEFRDALKDQAGRFVTREELTVIITNLMRRVEELKTFADKMTGKADSRSVWISIALAIIGLLLSAVSLLRGG